MGWDVLVSIRIPVSTDPALPAQVLGKLITISLCYHFSCGCFAPLTLRYVLLFNENVLLWRPMFTTFQWHVVPEFNFKVIIFQHLIKLSHSDCLKLYFFDTLLIKICITKKVCKTTRCIKCIILNYKVTFIIHSDLCNIFKLVPLPGAIIINEVL